MDSLKFGDRIGGGICERRTTQRQKAPENIELRTTLKIPRGEP